MFHWDLQTPKKSHIKAQLSSQSAFERRTYYPCGAGANPTLTWEWMFVVNLFVFLWAVGFFVRRIYAFLHVN